MKECEKARGRVAERVKGSDTKKMHAGANSTRTSRRSNSAIDSCEAFRQKELARARVTSVVLPVRAQGQRKSDIEMGIYVEHIFTQTDRE